MATWILYGLLSAVFAALTTILAKIGLSKVDATLATTLRAVIMTVFFVFISAIFGKFEGIGSLDKKALQFIVWSGFAGASSWLFYFLALKSGPATGTAVLDRMSIIFIAILAAFFLKETLTIKSLLGIVLVAAGAVLVVAK